MCKCPGYVSMPVVLFIWDQYIIGLDVQGFGEDYLAAVVAIFFILLKEKIRGCNSVSQSILIGSPFCAFVLL